MSLIHPKKPGDILARLLNDKRIPGQVYYDPKLHAWMFDWTGPQKLGTFYQAISMITGGSLDFIAEYHLRDLLEKAGKAGTEAGQAGQTYKNPYRPTYSSYETQFWTAWDEGYTKGEATLKVTPEQALKVGYDAGYADRPHKNPYVQVQAEGMTQWEAWEAGWVDGQQDRMIAKAAEY